MRSLLHHAGLVAPMGVIRLVNEEQRVIAHMEAGEGDEHNEHLPHETMSLEYKSEVAPHALHRRVCIKR